MKKLLDRIRQKMTRKSGTFSDPKKFVKLPRTLRELDGSYRSLIRELAKR